MDESVDAERRRYLGRIPPPADMEDRLFNVDELGLDGLISEGTFIGGKGDADLRSRASAWVRERVARL